MNNKVFPIGDLPVEVLEHIFSFLPLSDRKSASLVCQQWEKLTFSRRFLGNVKLELRLWCKSQQTFLLRSSRRYRHLSGFMDVYVGKESCFKYMLEIVDLFGQDVESLQCQGHFTTDQLFLVLSRLPNLQQLIVELHRWNQSIKLPTLLQLQAMGLLNNVLEIESLDVPMVTQLSIVIGSAAEGKDSMPVLKRLAPHLKHVDLNSNECFIPVEQLQFPKAEALRIGRTLFVAQIDLHLKTFFAGFKLLKEVVLDCHVEEITLDTITKACPGIELFKFNGGLLPIPLHLLERLKYLKES
nr:uncharacterized protein LOC109426677 [Aedes albopictus]